MGSPTPSKSCHVVLLLLGLTICVASIQLRLGIPSRPGPGFMPFGGGLLLFLSSVVGLVRDGVVERKADAPAGFRFVRMIVIVLLLAAYTLVLNRLGYIISTLALMIPIFSLMEHGNLPRSLVRGVLSVGITYLLFDKWLDCQLPRGILGF